MSAIAFSRSVLKKTDTGQVAAKAHYIAREGTYSPALAKVEYLGETRERTIRDDLVAKGTHHLPSFAQTAAEYFSAAEQYERANGIVATEWKFDLPKGLSLDAHRALIADVVGTMLPHNPVTWALHEPPGLSGEPHSHVHMLWSAREDDGIPRTPAQFFRRWNAAHPDQGGARKTPELNAWRAPVSAKEMYTDLANLHLERANKETRLHPGSYRDRGLPITPEPKLWPSDSQAYYATGVANTRILAVLKHRADMEPYRIEEAADAHAYWERRKVALGITADMTMADARARIAQGRGVIPTARLSVAARERLMEERERLEHVVILLDATQRGEPVPMHAMMAALASLEDEGIQRGRMRVKLFEEERRGYGR